jgi:hypothetical protein
MAEGRALGSSSQFYFVIQYIHFVWSAKRPYPMSFSKSDRAPTIQFSSIAALASGPPLGTARGLMRSRSLTYLQPQTSRMRKRRCHRFACGKQRDSELSQLHGDREGHASNLRMPRRRFHPQSISLNSSRRPLSQGPPTPLHTPMSKRQVRLIRSIDQ